MVKMEIKENLRRALRSDAGMSLVALTATATITLGGWAGLSYNHAQVYDPYEWNVAPKILDEVRTDDNLAKRAFAVILYPLALAQDAGNRLYKIIHE